MLKNSYHVIAKIDGGWKVIRANAKNATRNFASQKEAIEYGKRISRLHATEFVVHGADGRLVSKESFSKIPVSSKHVRV